MKIAYLAPFRDVDCERLIAYDRDHTPVEMVNSFLIWMILEYIKRGHQVAVFSITGGTGIDYVGNMLEVHSIPIFDHGNIRSIQRFVPDIKHLKKALKKADCDVYHAQWCYEFAAAALLLDPAKTVITMHDYPDVIAPFLGNFYWRHRLALGRKTLTAASYFTAVSPYMKNLVTEGKSEKYATSQVHLNLCTKLSPAGKGDGQIPEFVEVIPNYLIPSQLASMSFVSERSYDLIHPTIITLNDGFSDRKNCKNAMLAFSLLRKKMPGARLLMLGGDFEEGGIAQTWAKEQGIEEGISFMGFVSSKEVRSFMESSELCLSTSREESFGMTFIEAMGVGTLAAGGKYSGAVPWVLEDGAAGVLLDVEDPEAISNRLEEAFRDEAAYHRKVLHAREYVEAHFCLDVVADQYLEIYERISQNKASVN